MIIHYLKCHLCGEVVERTALITKATCFNCKKIRHNVHNEKYKIKKRKPVVNRKFLEINRRLSELKARIRVEEMRKNNYLRKYGKIIENTELESTVTENI